jgi:citrate synthase
MPGLQIPSLQTVVSDYLTRDEALAVLRVKAQTLYSYVSRGRIRSVPGPNARTSYYIREDIERVVAKAHGRARGGEGGRPASPGTVPAVQTSITEITRHGPRYRGYRAVDLARSLVPFEAVIELLWAGVLPDEVVPWKIRPEPKGLGQLIASVSKATSQPHVLKLMTMATIYQGLAEGNRFEREQSGMTPVSSARQLVRTLAGIFGAKGPKGRFVPLSDGEPIARGVIRALGLSNAREHEQAINIALVLLADHELDPATYAARITASGGADLHSCIGAALNAHYGSLLGRSCDRVEQLLSGAGEARSFMNMIEARLRSARRPPGFNHYLYPQGDPRAELLIDIAKQVAGRRAAIRQVTEVLTRARHEHDLRPSAELGLVMLCRALAIPGGVASGVLALSRCAGWVAHIWEQRLSGALIGPGVRYVGGPAGH